MPGQKISVIITAYNAQAYVMQCMNNLALQTYQNFEIIFVDNGSQDETGSIIRNAQMANDRIVILRIEKNIGVGDGRNKGLEYALNNSDSEFLFFLDVDDWLHPQCLELMLDAIKRDSSDIVFDKHGTPYSYNESFEPINNCEFTQYSDMETFWCDIMGTTAFITGRLIRKELFIDVLFPASGLDDERTTYKIVYNAKKVSLTNMNLYFWYQNPRSYMKYNWSPEKLKDQIESLRDPLPYFYVNNLKKTFYYYMRRYFKLLTGRMLDYPLKAYHDVFSDQFDYICEMNRQFPQFCNSDNIIEKIREATQNRCITEPCQRIIKATIKKLQSSHNTRIWRKMVGCSLRLFRVITKGVIVWGKIEYKIVNRLKN